MMKVPKNKKKNSSTKEIENLIKDATTMFLEQEALKKEKNRDLGVLAASISEFLDCFIVLGFDTNGNAVNITMAHNSKESNALSNFLINFAGGEDAESLEGDDNEDLDDCDEE